MEASLYERPELRKILPGIIQAESNHDQKFVSFSGFVYPPFMVMDRGVTLKEWMQVPRSFAAVVSMALEISELLDALHQAGQVHRDLKPDNALLSLHTHEWRLLDLGSAANIGAVSKPMMFEA
jgi:serine/threonine protein kinase